MVVKLVMLFKHNIIFIDGYFMNYWFNLDFLIKFLLVVLVFPQILCLIILSFNIIEHIYFLMVLF